MEFTDECRINKELKATLEKLKERIAKLEHIPKNPMDLNNDGKVDGKDASIAGKVMASRRKKK